MCIFAASQIINKMNKNFFKQQMHPMVWVSETTHCAVYSQGTPVGCVFINSLKINNYEEFRTSLCLVQD